jgi:hypothetical protein
VNIIEQYFADDRIIYNGRFAIFARHLIPSLPINKSRENKLTTNRRWGWQCRCSLSVFWTGRARDRVVPRDRHSDGTGWYKLASLSRGNRVPHSLETRLLSLREFDHQLQFRYDPRPVVTRSSLRPIVSFSVTSSMRTTSLLREISKVQHFAYSNLLSVYQFLISKFWNSNYLPLFIREEYWNQ